MLSIRVHTLDVATAYVNLGAFDLVQDGLEQLTSLRLERITLIIYRLQGGDCGVKDA